MGIRETESWSSKPDWQQHGRVLLTAQSLPSDSPILGKVEVTALDQTLIRQPPRIIRRLWNLRTGPPPATFSTSDGRTTGGHIKTGELNRYATLCGTPSFYSCQNQRHNSYTVSLSTFFSLKHLFFLKGQLISFPPLKLSSISRWAFNSWWKLILLVPCLLVSPLLFVFLEALIFLLPWSCLQLYQLLDLRAWLGNGCLGPDYAAVIVIVRVIVVCMSYWEGIKGKEKSFLCLAFRRSGIIDGRSLSAQWIGI